MIYCHWVVLYRPFGSEFTFFQENRNTTYHHLGWGSTFLAPSSHFPPSSPFLPLSSLLPSFPLPKKCKYSPCIHSRRLGYRGYFNLTTSTPPPHKKKCFFQRFRWFQAEAKTPPPPRFWWSHQKIVFSKFQVILSRKKLHRKNFLGEASYYRKLT